MSFSLLWTVNHRRLTPFFLSNALSPLSLKKPHTMRFQEKKSIARFAASYPCSTARIYMAYSCFSSNVNTYIWWFFLTNNARKATYHVFFFYFYKTQEQIFSTFRRAPRASHTGGTIYCSKTTLWISSSLQEGIKRWNVKCIFTCAVCVFCSYT